MIIIIVVIISIFFLSLGGRGGFGRLAAKPCGVVRRLDGATAADCHLQAKAARLKLGLRGTRSTRQPESLAMRLAKPSAPHPGAVRWRGG